MSMRKGAPLLAFLLAFSTSVAAPLGFTRLRSFGFPGSSAEYPQGRAILASDGDLYLTTLYGGATQRHFRAVLD